MQLRGKPPHVASALLVRVVTASLAVLAYNFYPITGPGYLFDNANNAFLHASSYPLTMTAPQFGAQNGMPSSSHLTYRLLANSSPFLI